jgi:hypothetical protein
LEDKRLTLHDRDTKTPTKNHSARPIVKQRRANRNIFLFLCEARGSAIASARKAKTEKFAAKLQTGVSQVTHLGILKQNPCQEIIPRTPVTGKIAITATIVAVKGRFSAACVKLIFQLISSRYFKPVPVL